MLEDFLEIPTFWSNSTQQPIEIGKNSLNQGVKIITETSSSAITKITGVTAKAKDTLIRVTDQSIDKVNVVTNNAIDKLNETADKTQASFNETLQSVEKLGSTVADASQQAIAASFQDWLNDHPIIAWLIAHPLFTLVLILLLWLILGGLLRAIARLSEEFWLAIFRSPFKLSRGLVGILPQIFISSYNWGITNLSPTPNDKEERLSLILSRLEEIKQEQDELWREMTAILARKT